MGWLSGWQTRGELVRHLKEGTSRRFMPVDDKPYGVRRAGWYEHRVLASCCVGNNMWSVHRITREYAESETAPVTERKESTFIVLFLIQKFPGGVWGYKDIEESMGPCEVNCPLSYLDMAPEPDGEYGRNWRERVRAFQAKRGMKLSIGLRVKLRSSSVPVVTIVSLKPLRGQTDTGMVYRVPRKLLDGVAV